MNSGTGFDTSKEVGETNLDKPSDGNISVADVTRLEHQSDNTGRMEQTCENHEKNINRVEGSNFKDRPEVIKFQIACCGENVEKIKPDTPERTNENVLESFKHRNRSLTLESSYSEEAFKVSPMNDLMDLQSPPKSTSTFLWSSVVSGDYIMRGKQTESSRVIKQSGEIMSDVSRQNDKVKQSLAKEEYITIAGITQIKHQSHSSHQEKNTCNDRGTNIREEHTDKQDCNENAAEIFGDSSDSEWEYEPIFSKTRIKYKKYSDFDKEEADSNGTELLNESDEEISLFEKSQLLHDDETTGTEIDECFDYQIILNEGLYLSSDYRDKFNDKNTRVLGREPFYMEDCSDYEMESKLKANPNMYMICSIYVETPHHAYCVPVKSNKNTKIEISGRSKAGQCFTEDEVFVQILNVDKAIHGLVKTYGKVLKRVKQHRYRDVQHPVFVCILDDQAGNLMVPLCKTLPKIHILDSKVKRNFPKHRNNYVDIYKYNTGDTELHFRETRFISDNCREKFVFIVVFLTWSRRHIYPLGAVIDVLSAGSRSINTSLRVLDSMYSVPYLYGKQTVEHVQCILSKYEENQQTLIDDRRDNLTNLRVFTIDPDHATALDDALSIETQEQGHRVGVHITDVTIFIKKDDPTDQEARERLETFYSNIQKPRRLLPEPVSENVWSLLPNKERNCLSIFFHFDSNGKIIEQPVIKSTIIQSHLKLSYSIVQKILEGETTDVDQIVATDLRQLFRLATKLRKRRLGNAMYASCLKEFDEFEARYLVEEFMVLANKCVTEKLLEVYPNQVPLICLDPPSESNIERWWSEHQSVVHVLLSLQDRFLTEEKTPSLKEALDDQDGHVIHVSEKFLRVICVQDEIDLRLACKMLKLDELHPLQSTALHEWYSIQNKTIYQCSSQLRERSVDQNCFHINGCPYTNFTSPLRRYFDIVVHRLVHCMIHNEKCCYTQEEIEELCSYFNEQASRAGLYEDKCRSLVIARSLEPCPKLCTCIIVDVSDEGITFVAPAIDEIQTLFLSFKLLVMISKPEVTQNTKYKRNVTTKWKRRLYARIYSIPSLPYTDYTTVRNIDPYKELGFVPVKDWANALIKLVYNQQNEEMAQALKDMANVVSLKHVAGRENAVTDVSFSPDVSTEDFYDKDKEAMAPFASFSMTFFCGQTINVQVSAVFHGGILTPYPQLFEMTKNIQFCLQHTDDPLKWLYRYSSLRTISTYADEYDYQRRWIPLVKMEAAIDAVNNEESYVINNLPVLFDGKWGQFSLPVRYCQIRNILLNNMDHEINDDDNDDDEQNGKQKKPIVNLAHDWLCVRSKMVSSTDKINANGTDHHNYCFWIAHGKIKSVEIRSREKRTDRHTTRRTYAPTQEGKEKARVTVDFQLHRTAPSIPSDTGEMCRIKCNIEILTKSTVDRRTESYLKILNSASILAKAIALGRWIPRLDRKHLRESVLSDREVHVAPLHPNNQSQRDAIDRSLVSAFSLIQGPPGSGKSHTAIKLVYLFSKINSKINQGEQVLFCGPSNKSVDNVARWTKELEECPKIVRLYGRSIEALDYPIPGAEFTSKRSMRYLKSDENLHDITVHHLIRKIGKPFAEQIREFDRRFRNENYIPHFEEVSKYMSLISKATVEELQQYEVIMCTTGVATSPKLLKGTNIYQLIIDEAGMCTEPHCMAPIIANNVKQVILIGDHKQLRPIIKCKSAATLGMSKSLFERYAEDLKDTNYRKNVKYSFLNMQYRMHPNLCQFPSNKFYNGELQTSPEVFKREKENAPLKFWPVPQKPIILCHVEGSEEILTVSTEEGNEKSRSNLEEFKQVVKIFKYMVEVEMVEVRDINVISQYNAQCHALRKALDKENYKDFNVNTVVASQGGEWDYVIFSTVRSLSVHQIEPFPTLGWCTKNLGFITDHHQINVALTRARRGLIIVGNKTLLMCDEVWRSLVKQYEASRCVVTSWEFPPGSSDIADDVPT
ncbi:hypothetical protein CHS0354_026457 [Potamilus streckersoni]|uniref:RNB domain-containing protein n=1 Tax=Potamilus streckersoni TaxID=2493646 RepID=A0AAE0RQ81_9BIVA|nr:hypothetical protein CHS0354_026457 [Potamilus streckersoni]